MAFYYGDNLKVSTIVSILILIVNWQDSRLSITPMFHSDYDYDYEITLFEHKQNQHIHIIIVQ